MWRDEPRTLTFVEQPSDGPSSLIDAVGFVRVGAELLAGVPRSPLGFLEPEVRRCIQDLILAGYAFTESLKLDDRAEVREALAACDQRRSLWVAGLAAAPPVRALGAVPVPAHGFLPPAPIAEWLSRPLPFSVDEIPAELHVVARAEDGRFLIRHAAHTLAWFTVSAERMVTDIQILTGRAALTAFLESGFSLLEVQKARLRACGQAGDPLEDLIQNGLGEGQARAILELRDGEERVRFLEVESRDPRYRGALLVVRLDDATRVLGFRVVEGVVGYEMMGLADATAPHLPGPAGEPPVAGSMVQLDAELQRVAANVRPILEALVQPGSSPDVVAQLRPRAGESAEVFTGSPEFLAEAEARYAQLWASDPPRVRAPAAAVTVKIHVAPAGMLAPDAEASANWPQPYARVAGKLRPDRVWVAWAYLPVGGGRGTDYDGIVWTGERWVWFPSPHRVLT